MALLVLLVLVAALLAALVWWPAGRSAASPVDHALPFALADVRPGRPQAVLSAHPGRPIVLNFFAAWCDPCHAEVPLLADLERREGDRLSVLGVDMQDNRDLAAQLLAGAGVTYPAGYDPNRVVSEPWQVDGLPVTVFIAPDGTVVDYHRGQLQAGDLAHRVDSLLRRSATTVPHPAGTGA